MADDRECHVRNASSPSARGVEIRASARMPWWEGAPLLLFCRLLNLAERLGVAPTLTPDRMLSAYAHGIFPMGRSATDPRLAWFYPERRGVLPLEAFHLPRRLADTIKSGRYHATFDTHFDAIVDGCAQTGENRPDTWINPQMRALAIDLHRQGHAHSVEIWNDSQIVGGLFGVALGGAFFAESMFGTVRDVSKIALVHLIATLRHCGFRMVDTQFSSEHLAQFGGLWIPRAEYHARLADALSCTIHFEPTVATQTLDAVLRSGAG